MASCSDFEQLKRLANRFRRFIRLVFLGVVLKKKKAWRRPTLPRTEHTGKVCSVRSTIGAGGLNFRVRNGNGWDPSAIITRHYSLFCTSALRSVTQAAQLTSRSTQRFIARSIIN